MHPDAPTRDGERTALVVAHPGHELLVQGWLETARPRVCVLTDGSGHSGRSRLPSTSRVLDPAGARPGCVYGRFTDSALYAALLRRDVGLFRGLAEELADAFVRDDIAAVAGDAWEGYNPAHDVCRLLVNAAVKRVRARTGRALRNYAFPLTLPPAPSPAPPAVFRLCLDDGALGRKLARARAYPELADEVNGALARLGPDAFRTECLHPVGAGEGLRPFEGPPFYEEYGERQVAAGRYRQALRYREHVRPLAHALLRPARARAA
jgi:hypothetical protein